MGLGGVAAKLGLQALGGLGSGDSYVVMGAMTECTWGSLDSRLILPISHGVYIKGRAQLNKRDFIPFINILPFGMCKSLLNPAVLAIISATQGSVRQVPCTPIVVMPWFSAKEDKMVEKQPALLCSSMNMCLFGGLITINDDGQR